ncbi:MAG: LysE family translocator [Fimbriimonadaceae bacterium]|nr:LysE family translocator [Alphaproteobacteria bacterium]
MAWETWIFYLGTVLALMSTPGPSHLLMLSNSVAHGFPRSLSTAAGDLTANLFQMLAAGLGLAALLVASQNALTMVKWAGVAYLLWLGFNMIRKTGRSGKTAAPARRASLKSLWLQGFLTSAVNPKAVVFFAALFPQFISAAEPFWFQFGVLSTTYLALDGLFLGVYGASSGWIAARLKEKGRKWVDRVGGSFIIVAAILLGLKTIREAS